ncbi:MAG: hypothetical protein Q9224_001176 [Gallowayella concinna]
MSEYATQLTAVLVNEVFGELPSQVYHVLAFNGRLSLSGLVHHTSFSSTELKHSLSVLIQHHLVHWYSPDHESHSFYEANLENSYALTRFGKYIQLLRHRFGDYAGDLISDIITLGHASVGDLTRTYVPLADEPGPLIEIIPSEHCSLPSGKHYMKSDNFTKETAHTADDLHSIVGELLRAGVLRSVHESYFRPAADNIAEAEASVPYDSSTKGKKQQEANWEASVQKKLEDWKYGSKAETKALAQTLRGMKRTYEGDEDEQPSKKRKIAGFRNCSNGTGGNQDSASSGWLDHDLLLRVNHEKLTIMMRNQQLVTLAEDSVGTPTSTVYAELLRLAEPQLRKCKNELNFAGDDTEVDLRALPQVSTEDLAEIMYSTQSPPDLSGALGYVDPSRIDLRKLLNQPKKPRKRRKTVGQDVDEASVEGSASSDESEEESSGESEPDTPNTTPETTPKMNGAATRTDTLRQHLLLLAEQPQQFLIPVPRTKADPEKWAIPYPTLSKTLLHNAILNITTSRFGPLATRLIRILAANDNGTKLDEKMLVLLSLIPQKQMPRSDDRA